MNHFEIVKSILEKCCREVRYFLETKRRNIQIYHNQIISRWKMSSVEKPQTV